MERTGIAGALVDTFVKDGRGLYGWLAESELAELVGRTRQAGGTFASPASCAWASCAACRADVVGVRSAVCRGGDRTAALDAELGGGRGGRGARRSAGHDPGVRPRKCGPALRTTTATPVRRTASGR